MSQINEEKMDEINAINKSKKNQTWITTYGILHLVAFVFAIYLSFKCHGKFDIGSFIVAFFCPWIYIIWVLATRGPKMCFNYTNGKVADVINLP